MNTPLQDYLVDKGYTCPICYDIYDINQDKKKPTQLSCQQHNVCIECIEKNGSQLKNCPICRKPLVLSKLFDPNSQIIWAMEMATELWLKAHPSEIKAIASISNRLLDSSPVPEQFKCLSLCEMFWNYKNINSEIEASLPFIVQTMEWEDIYMEFIKTFYESNQNWVLLEDKDTETAKGVACLKLLNNNHWEMHWGGIMKDDTEEYLELYKQLLSFVERKAKGEAEDWLHVSLTTYFNYDHKQEHKFLECLICLVFNKLKMRFELKHLHPKWGTQAKVTVFPIRKEGRIQNKIETNPNNRLLQNISFETTVLPFVTHYLENLELNKLFRLWAADEPNPEHTASYMKEKFLSEPHRFFIYTINHIAGGFMFFTRVDGNLRIESCNILPQASKYADHFIAQFVNWAKTEYTYAKGVKAKNINFSCKGFFPKTLKSAIDKYLNKS